MARDLMFLLMLGVDTSRIVLSFSGLDEAEACWIRRLLRAIGKSRALRVCLHWTRVCFIMLTMLCV